MSEDPHEGARSIIRDITLRSVCCAIASLALLGVVMLVMFLSGVLVVAGDNQGDGKMKCPFCKKETAEAIQEQSIQSGRMLGHRVVCRNQDCKAQGPVRASKKNAMTAWNRALK